MTDLRPIRRALLSVSDKTGLIDLARALDAAGVVLLSTGGTAKSLRDAGLSVVDVAEATGFPEIMDGRVKTLHPKIHGGLLARADDTAHDAALAEHGIDRIDLLAVNLYPFSETVAGGADRADCIEKIDVGGPAMLRAAAKNHGAVAVVVDPADYADVAAAVGGAGGLDGAARARLAHKAFSHTAAYDAAVAAWLAEDIGRVAEPEGAPTPLRYGENPHQAAWLRLDGSGRPGVATAEVLQGKALSYNNILDADAAFELAAELDGPGVVIVKHGNPCGVSQAADLAQAYSEALLCDPVSAFGGIVACNRPIDGPTAETLSKLFLEVVIAPGFAPEALAAFAARPNLRVLGTGGMPTDAAGGTLLRTVAGGVLMQDRDTRRVVAEDLKVVTRVAPTPEQIGDMLFAFTVAKHVKSNAIVLAEGGATVGIGAGQMSRVDSTRMAVWKAAESSDAAGMPQSRAIGSVLASDAFFPFPDGIEAAAAAGVSAVVQPGGSVRDSDIVAAADAHGIAMAFTGVRHFRH